MTRLRIGYLMGGLKPGGAERQMLNLAMRLPPDRFAIDFLTLTGTSEYDDHAIAAGAHVRVLDTRRDAGHASLLSLPRRSMKALRYVDVVRRERYHIIDAWLYPADVVAAALRVVTRTPIVISGRRNLDPHDKFGPLEGFFDSMVNRMADAVVANSAAAAAHAMSLQRISAAKIHVIRNGVESPVALSADQLAKHRHELGVREGEFVLGCVGNFHVGKRQALLIDVMADLVDEHPRLRLVLVGDGVMRSSLQEQTRRLGLEGVVKFRGSVLDPVPLYPCFDVVVQTSRSEGLPNVLLEAAVSGRPIVATDAGGTGEIVIDGQTGLLVPLEDRDALSTALRRMIGDAELRARLGAAAKLHAESKFGMDRFVREFASLYEGLARSRRLID